MLYPLLLGACGRNVVFGQNVVLRHPHKIHIGDNVVIDDNCLLDAKGDSERGIDIGSGVFIGRNTILSCKNGDIELGDGANIGFNCEVFSASRVAIGTRHAARGVLLRDRRRPRLARSVARRCSSRAASSPASTVGAGAWLGAGAKVLDGVTIGDGAIIGAGAVVRERRFPHGAIAVGVPARVVGTRDEGRGHAGGRGMSAPSGRPRDALNVLQVCDHLGWEGSRMHGVKRLFAWMIPRFDPARFNVSLVSLRKKDLSEETLDALGIDITYLHRSKFDPATLPALLKVIDRKQIDILHLHGYGATTFGRLARRRCAGSRRSCTSTRTSPTRRGSRRWPTGCWRRYTDMAIAVSASTAEFVITRAAGPAENA